MMSTRNQPSTGKPRMLASPSQWNAGSDLLLMSHPPVMMRATPVKMIWVPRVTMMKFAFTRAMRYPFNRPQATPTASEPAMETAYP